MKFVITEYNHCTLFEVSGRIDSYSAPQIDDALKSLLKDDQWKIVIDMENVSFISSSGILVFVNTQKHLIHQNLGEIVFANVPENVLSSFKLAGFDTLFEFFEDATAAVGSF